MDVYARRARRPIASSLSIQDYDDDNIDAQFIPPLLGSLAHPPVNGETTDAQLKAFLQKFKDQAEMEGFWDSLKEYGSKALSSIKRIGMKYGPTALRIANELVNGGASEAQVEAFLQSFQDQAEMEGFLDSLKEYGSKALSSIKRIGMKYGPTALRIANELVNGGASEAQVEAFLQSFQDQAEMEGFWDSLKEYGSKALSSIKRIGMKYGPTALRIVNELVNGGASEAQVEAFLQSFQDQAEMEEFWDSLKEYKSMVGMKYGPTGLRIAHGLVNGGASEAQVEAFLQSFHN